MSRQNKRYFIILVTIGVLCLISVGFSILSTNLDIVGTAGLKSATWNIYWDNVIVSDGSVEANTPTISNGTTVEYEITLSEPGDFYEFTVDAINDGSIDAMIDSISSKLNGVEITELPSYLNYTVTYFDGTPLARNQLLLSNSYEIYKVRIEYKRDINVSDLVQTDTDYSLQFRVTYVQANDQAVVVGRTVANCENHILKTTVPRNITGLARIMGNNAYLDNGYSEFVNNCAGVDFNAISSDTNGKGIYEIASTKNDPYPIYYYRGEVDNNVKFAGFCWKAIRTTDTGGVKMIYNGLPDDNGDCTNTTGASTYVTTSRYNSGSPHSLAEVGYMYGTIDHSPTGSRYENKEMSLESSTNLLNVTNLIDSHYYGTSYDWNTIHNGEYTLTGDITLGSDHADPSELVGLYTLGYYNTSPTGSYFTINYIFGNKNNALYYVSLYSGNSLESYNKTYYFYTDTSHHGEVAIKTFDWPFNYTNITAGMYACGTTRNCDSPGYVIKTSARDYTTLPGFGYLYGNSVSYQSGTYTLTDTIEMTPSNYSNLENFNNNHYSCFNTTGTCSTVYYVFGTGNRIFQYYIEITGVDPGGNELIDVVRDDIFSNDADSSIKRIVDSWYAANMLNYTGYLEDTVYCNDRSINNAGGWNPDGGSMKGSIVFSGANRYDVLQPSLACAREDDRFSVSPTVGNGKLTYPVGIITLDELMYAGGQMPKGNETYYLSSGRLWTATPGSYVVIDNARIFDLDGAGAIYLHQIHVQHAVRPVISLSSNAEIEEGGDGSPTNPYVVVTQ